MIRPGDLRNPEQGLKVEKPVPVKLHEREAPATGPSLVACIRAAVQRWRRLRGEEHPNG